MHTCMQDSTVVAVTVTVTVTDAKSNRNMNHEIPKLLLSQ